MKFPKEIVEKAKELYPEDVYLQILLENGNPKASNFFLEATAEELVRAILRTRTLEEAHHIAAREIERKEFKKTWAEMINSQTMSK